jgi:chorismate synthase
VARRREGIGQIVAWVEQVHDISADIDVTKVSAEDVGSQGAIQCPDPRAAQEMVKRIETVRKDGDTVGGVIGCVVRNVPVGLGDPVFDKLDANLAKAMLSLPSTKGFEIGSGFSGTRLMGSAHNDPFAPDPAGAGVVTTRNASGGIQGGISNGMPIVMRVAFKPVATHFKVQDTVNTDGEQISFQASGRHDPCVLPRAVVIVESMAALTLCDAVLRQRGQVGA